MKVEFLLDENLKQAIDLDSKYLKMAKTDTDFDTSRTAIILRLSV